MNARLDAADAARVLQRGGLVAYPTEAVWGLGCDPRDEAATLRLLALKIREVDKGLILIAADEAQLAPFIDMDALDAAQRDAVRASWPGPHTWIVPASPSAPRWITGAHDGIAVRISAHPIVVELCNAFDGALVSTSANLSGKDAPRSREGLDPAVLAAVAGHVTGETGGLSAPTVIRDALTGVALRI